MGQGHSVALRNIHNKYVGAEEGGGVMADQYSPGDNERFHIHFVNPTTVAFRSSYGKWLCAEPSGYVVCNREYRSDWEAFHMVPTSNGKFGFRAHNAKFLTSGQDGYLTASSATAIGEWEMYDLEIMEMSNAHVALVGVHGKYLSVESSGRVHALHLDSGKNEVFSKKVVGPNRVAFKGSNGKYLAADSHGQVSCTLENMTDRAIFFYPSRPRQPILFSLLLRLISLCRSRW